MSLGKLCKIVDLLTWDFQGGYLLGLIRGIDNSMWKNAWKDVFTVQFGKIIFMIRWLLTWGRGFQTTVQ